MEHRDAPVSREPEVPDLTPEEVERITRVVFSPSTPLLAADLLFVFGTVHARWDDLAKGWHAGLYPRIVLAGRSGPSFTERHVPTSHVMREHLLARGVASTAIAVQDRSSNTREDVLFSLDLIRVGGVVPRRLVYAAKAHHSGRCWLTLRRLVPGTELFAYTFPAVHCDVVVEAATWFQHPVARARAYGEYLRILAYSARGDIASPEG